MSKSKDDILNEALKSILSYIDFKVYPDAKKFVKLVLGNFGLAMQIELMKEINNNEK